MKHLQCVTKEGLPAMAALTWVERVKCLHPVLEIGDAPQCKEEREDSDPCENKFLWCVS
jgi:hypothetical protein